MEQQAKKAFVFDLDGTLLDSLADIASCGNRALEQSGYPTHTLEEYRVFVGNGAKKLIERAMPAGSSAEECARMLDLYNAIYLEVCGSGCRLFDGVKELLDTLHDRGAVTAAVSNKPQAHTQAVFRSTFPGLLDAAAGQIEGVPLKPAPDGVNRILEQLGAECAAYVGDSDVDLKTGRNGGWFTVGVTWGNKSRAQLEEIGADAIVDTMEQLREVLLSRL